MNANVTKLLATALVVGLISGGSAFANKEHGKKAGDKNKCKGHHGKKDACKGKDGCKGHDKKDAAAEAGHPAEGAAPAAE